MRSPPDSGPAAPVSIPISDVPVAPVTLSFVSDPPAPAQPARTRSQEASAVRRAAAWGADLALLIPLFGGEVAIAAHLCGRSLAGVLLAAPFLWAAFAAALALAWSWVFIALAGRTPGMAIMGQRLRRLQGGALTPLGAFVRALLAVAFAAPALFGFAYALLDPRAQTLHDKLCHCVVVLE